MNESKCEEQNKKKAPLTNADMQICPNNSPQRDRCAHLFFWGVKVVCIALHVEA